MVIEPIDYTSDIGKVRLYLGDVSDPFIFQDEQIAAFLEVSGGNVKRAAASGLLVIAGTEAYLYKYVRTDDLLVDGPKVAAELRAQAQQLRTEADLEDEADLEHFQVVYNQACCGYEYQEHPQVRLWSDPCPW